MIRAVLLDVDGTLMDNNMLHVKSWQEAFQPYKAFTEAELLRYVGMGSDLYVQSLAPDLDTARQQAIRDRKREVYKDIGRKALPFPGSKRLLQAAKDRGLKVALASSANGTEIRRYIEEMGVAEQIDAMTTASDVKHTKPEPDLFLAALDKLGVAAHEAFVVGDTPYDVAAASKAGMPTVGVLSGGFAGASLEAAGAILVLKDVGELADRLDEVLQRLQG